MNCTIKSVEKSDEYYTVIVVLPTILRDYIIDSDKKIIKGSKTKVYFNDYELEFIIKRKDVKNCPNCGAEINGTKCNYCKSIITNNEQNLSLSKKKIISQTSEELIIILLELIGVTIFAIFLICWITLKIALIGF